MLTQPKQDDSTMLQNLADYANSDDVVPVNPNPNMVYV